jgi:hypothetical protein
MKLTNRQRIINVMSKSMYQTPEGINDDLYVRYEKLLKVSNVERRLRELREEGVVESKKFQNATNNGKHCRWKLAEVK